MGRQRAKASAAILALALVSLTLAACGSSGSTGTGEAGGGSATEAAETVSKPESTARTGGEIVWGKPTELTSYDPNLIDGGPSAEILQLVYEPLVSSVGTKVVPGVAESWEQTAPDEYVFTIRKDAKFSNGKPVTVADVVGSVKRATAPEASYWSEFPGVKTVKAMGQNKVAITTKGVRTSFLPAMSYIAMAILPMEELEAGNFDPSKEVLGSGPFMVAAHKKDNYWTLVPNPYYWNKDLPRVDKLTVRYMPEEAARIAGLRDGSVDVSTFSSPDAVQLLEGVPNVETFNQKTTGFYRLDINAKTSIFKDKKLREAVSLAIDRQEIAETALAGQSEPSSILTSAFGPVCPAEEMPFGEPDVAKAKELVEEAGAVGKTIVINDYNVVIPESKPIAEVMQKQLEAIGFNVEIESLELGEADKRIFGTHADFDLALGLSTGYSDAAMGLRNWNPEEAGWNVSFVLPDPEINELIKKTSAMKPGPERDADLKKVCTAVAANANDIALDTVSQTIAWRSDAVEPDLEEVETNEIPLRTLAGFGVKTGS
jgi:peptide/nickel transport system substrate-binding protein